MRDYQLARSEPLRLGEVIGVSQTAVKGVYKMLPYNQALKPFSRDLRTNMTDAEQLLWSRLRRKQILSVSFYRQKPIAGYIVDFYCAAARLVIELDGSQHYEKIAQAQDKERDKLMAALGLQVLRFDNRQVLLETEAVMQVIFATVGERVNGGNSL